MFDYNQQYYNEDQQIGEKCFFNDRDVYLDFNADLRSFHMEPGDIDVDYAPATGNSDFNLFNRKNEAKTLIIEFYVGGPSYEAVQTNISNLLVAARKCVIRKEGDIFEYAAVLNDRECEDTNVEPYYLVSLKFAVIRRKPLKTYRVSDGCYVYNEGNEESGMLISIRPEEALSSFTIEGITIQKLVPGTVYVIDGLHGRVTADGINYFSNTDIVDFPKIKPGRNQIKMSENIPVTVSFYPVFA